LEGWERRAGKSNYKTYNLQVFNAYESSFVILKYLLLFQNLKNLKLISKFKLENSKSDTFIASILIWP